MNSNTIKKILSKTLIFALCLTFTFGAVGCGEKSEESNSELLSRISELEAQNSEYEREISRLISERPKNILDDYDIDNSIENIVDKTQTYKHVVIIGVDGAGTYFEKANTPNIDSIFSESFKTNYCITSIPTNSAECWGSLLTGVFPDIHGRTNGKLSKEKYNNAEYPTLFKIIQSQNETAKLASYCEWEEINKGLIESDVTVDKKTGKSSETIKEQVLSKISSDFPDFLFVQFDSVDAKGHTSIFGGEKYLAQINKIDGYIGEIYNAIEESGKSNDTLFIVTADHGGTLLFHGGDSDLEKYVFLGIKGKTVGKCVNAATSIRNIAGIVIYSLGLKGNAKWRVPEGLLNKISRENISFGK